MSMKEWILLSVDAGALVYDHDALRLRYVHDLLGVRVVRRAVRVGSDPLQQVVVLHSCR